MKALAKDVDDRYQNAIELADDLQRFLITSDSIFSRKDLMQYMKSTFAEEVDREKARLAEYADIKAPDSLLAAMDAAHGTQSAPAPVGNGSVGSGGAVVVRPAGPSIPKLTATSPQREVHAEDGATLLVDGNEFLQGGPPPTNTRSPPPRLPAEPVTDPALEAAPVLTVTPPEPASRPLSRSETFIPPRPPQEPEKEPLPALVQGVELIATEAPPAVQPEPSSTRDAVPPLRRREPQDWTPSLVGRPGGGGGGRPASFLRRARAAPGHAAPGPLTLRRARPCPRQPQRQGPRDSVQLALFSPGPRKRRGGGAGDRGRLQAWAGTVTVARGSLGTPFTVPLQRTVGTARLVVLPDPDDAEVRLNGTPVKRAGVHGFYAGEVPVGMDQQVEVRRGGFRPYVSSVLAHTAEDALQVRAVLEPFEYTVRVTSQPPGAVVFSGERELGVTPVTGKVPATASALTLRKRCFETAQVPLRLPEQPGPPRPVRVVLRKVPGCR